MDKRTPERTCIGCGFKREKDDLVRIVLSQDGEGNVLRLTPDPDGVMKGRGAYLCRKSECLEKAVKKKAFNRAFKRTIMQEALNGLGNDFLKTQEAYEQE